MCWLVWAEWPETQPTSANNLGTLPWIDLKCQPVLDRVIADRIDSDNNGKVTEEELTLWVRNVEHQHIMNDSKRIWKDYNEDLTHKITWNEYIHATFGEFKG